MYLAIVALLLLFAIFGWVHYLIVHNIISTREPFESTLKDTGSPETSHNVDLPLNTTYSCSNMCGPLSRCAITGEQCTSDVDCYGCVKNDDESEGFAGLEGFEGLKGKDVDIDVVGQNHSGKLTSAVPSYSTLTSDIGSKSRFYNNGLDKFSPVPQANFGENMWKPISDIGLDLYKKSRDWEKDAYPEKFQFLPKYPSRATTTGLFSNDEPLAANDFL
jgi:hypothetical protein